MCTYPQESAPPLMLSRLMNLKTAPGTKLGVGVPWSKRTSLSCIREAFSGMCEIDCKSLVLFSGYWTCSFNIFNVFLTFTKCLASFGQSLFEAFYWKYPWVVPKHCILFQSMLNIPEEGIVNVEYHDCQSWAHILPVWMMIYFFLKQYTYLAVRFLPGCYGNALFH